LVNEKGISLTGDPIEATYNGTETTIFSTSNLPAGNWLYIDIVQKDVGVVDPKQGETGGTPGAEEPPAGSIDVEILGLLTITITCTTY
jgi:hypothetical protein